MGKGKAKSRTDKYTLAIGRQGKKEAGKGEKLWGLLEREKKIIAEGKMRCLL